jgi:hypothetical protein
MSDQAWTDLGNHADDADYFAAFKSAFDLDIGQI